MPLRRWLWLPLALLACDSPTAVLKVTKREVPTVQVEIARLHRYADLILVNELDILYKKGFTCEQKDVETETVVLNENGGFILQKELWACWRIVYTTVIQEP